MGCKPPFTYHKKFSYLLAISGAKVRKNFSPVGNIFAAQAAIAGFGEGTPQQVSHEGQNRRIADFGTVVETCSVTAADCPCLVFPYIERTAQGLRPAVGGLFSFPLKIHFKGCQLPAGWGFFKISFALVIRATGFWQPAGQRIFPFTPYYGQKSKMPNAGAEKFLPHLLLQSEQGKMAGNGAGQQKKQQIFFRLTAFTGRRWRLIFGFLVGYQSCNLGFLNHIFLS